ncbi:ATP-binding protein [Desulfosporosinus meridiei]|uniref:histidine kinase n=1 Tax=Desulfosporosinus meridiei (strain ATCC BAA-275 / DSM 13257 / KCTC 12902 / NCIMB 13706 / S10) TaxID=768704 RepID=J7J3A1_DESMD|nr:ATP-binding protein [Desulfosporosinus meridiei]AFQ45451.1 histidine kinase,HAMP domain-containing protein,histidine kinase [Desulfosporosinus meridiei DSM 13257]
MKAGKTLWNQRIKTRVLVFGILMSIIPMVFISLTTFNTVRYKFKDSIREQNIQKTMVIATKLQVSITNIVESLANLTDVNSTVLIKGKDKEQEGILNIVLRQEPYLEDIKILDKNLNILVQVSRREVITDGIVSNADYVGPETMPEHYSVSDVFFSKDRRPQFFITLGIRDTQTREHLGYLQAKADLKLMINQYIDTRIGHKGYVFFVDEEGSLIGHTDFSRVLSQKDIRKNPAVSSFLTGEEPPNEYTGDQGGKVIGSFARVDKPNWGVFIEQPVIEAYEPIYELARNLGGVLFLTIAVVTILSIVFGLKLVQPIEDLETQVKKIKVTGDLQADISYSSQDEIGRLAYSFKQLMAMLDKKNQNIKAEKELLRTVVDGIGAGMVLLNGQKQIIWWNPTFAEWFGETNYFNLSCEDIVQSEEDFDCSFLQSGRVNPFVFDGERKYLRQLHYQIPSENSEGAVYLVILEDVTQQVEMESRVIETDKMATLGLLASGIAHEINNPLAIVSAYSEDLLDCLNEEPNKVDIDEIKESLRITSEQIVRCKQITDGLLQFSRKRQHSFSMMDIGAVSSQVIKLLEYKAKQKFITLKRKLNPGLYIAGNENEWQQVVLNILSNALDASPTNSQVEIESCRIDGSIYFIVKDNGQGIPQNQLKSVFNPFFTTKPVGQGTGLGLFVSYGIIQRMNGRLIIESTEGKGTTVSITLPAYKGG